MCQKIHDLYEAVEAFLRELGLKGEADRTKREELLMESGRVFADQLLRYYAVEKAQKAEPAMNHRDLEIATILKAYNEINRRYDLRDADAEALAKFRQAAKK